MGFPDMLFRGMRPFLRLVTAVGLVIDAYVHIRLAPQYDLVGNPLTEGMLFRAQGVVAALAAVVIVLSGRRLAFILAFVVSASAVAALLLYTYVDVGAIGPFPNMYEPVWFPQKALAAVAEGAATLAGLSGALLPLSPRSGRKGRGVRSGR